MSPSSSAAYPEKGSKRKKSRLGFSFFFLRALSLERKEKGCLVFREGMKS